MIIIFMVTFLVKNKGLDSIFQLLVFYLKKNIINHRLINIFSKSLLICIFVIFIGITQWNNDFLYFYPKDRGLILQISYLSFSQLSVAILTQATSKTKKFCTNYFFNIFSKSQGIRGCRFKTTNQKSAYFSKNILKSAISRQLKFWKFLGSKSVPSFVPLLKSYTHILKFRVFVLFWFSNLLKRSKCAKI